MLQLVTPELYLCLTKCAEEPHRPYLSLCTTKDRWLSTRCFAKLNNFFLTSCRDSSWVPCGVSPNVSAKIGQNLTLLSTLGLSYMLCFLLQSTDFCFLKYLNRCIYCTLEVFFSPEGALQRQVKYGWLSKANGIIGLPRLFSH